MFAQFDDDESGSLTFGECFCLIPELEKEAMRRTKADAKEQSCNILIEIASIRFLINM